MEETRANETALSLMRMALALLDRAGRTFAAARLQHAINALTASEHADPLAELFERDQRDHAGADMRLDP